MATWTEARATKTAAEYRDDFLAELDAAGSSVRGYSNGAPQRALVEGEARSMASLHDIAAALASTAGKDFVALAGDDWVDAAMSWFDLDDGTGGKGRIKATKAEWLIPLQVTPSSAPLTITPASQIQLQANDGTIFDCAQQTSLTLNAGSSYKGTARFLARAAGISGNVIPGQITKRITGPAGLSVNIDETQTQVTSARNQESNEAFVARGLGRWGTISVAGWTVTSFDFLVPSASTAITRWKIDDSSPFGPGTVGVVIAQTSSTATAQQVTDVSNYLAGATLKTLGNPAPTVSAAGTTTVSVTGSIESDGSNPNLLSDAITALVLLDIAFPIGGLVSSPGVLPFELLQAVLIGGAFPQYSIPGFSGATGQLTLSSPAADVSIGASDVIIFDTSGLSVVSA